MEKPIQALADPICYSRKIREPRFTPPKVRLSLTKILRSNFIKRNGVLIIALIVLLADTGITAGVTQKNVTEELTAQYDAEYEAKIEAFQQEWMRDHFITGEDSLNLAMDQEADEIARAIGQMKTKRMKLSMTWNILVRVDNPAYPNNVRDVVNQPQQWMFYNKDNPIREDDKQLVLEQLKLWHDKRYPAGLTSAFIYGEWSDNDYVLRDSWEKNSHTNYWRFPE